MTLNCAVIDDEPLARECIVQYIGQIDFLRLAGTGSNPLELSRLLHEQTVDLVLLDIHMPGMSGIEFLKMTPAAPLAILITAYPHYALEGFALDVMDYLVKPITFNRFFQAVTKTRDYHQLLNRAERVAVEEEYFFIKCDYKYERIERRDILYIAAMQNYITIYTTKGKFMTLMSLRQVEQNLDSSAFVRVHKSYLVSISKINSIENNELVIEKARIPISRHYRDAVLRKVVEGKLWKK